MVLLSIVDPDPDGDSDSDKPELRAIAPSVRPTHRLIATPGNPTL
jgi:hypothetical protein